MRHIWREVLFLLRTRIGVAATLLLIALATVSLSVGLKEVERQNNAIDRMLALQKIETEAVKKFATEAGDAAYYSFHPTYKRPAPLAFAALGQSDIAPSMLRIRALALEAQLYDNETSNPELALQGSFDFAFVLIYLTPLVIIALFYDLWSGEREAGRLKALQAMPRSSTRVWRARAAVRAVIVWIALCIPLCVAALIAQAPWQDTLAFLAWIAALVGFWCVVCLAVARLEVTSSVHAASLSAIWLCVTLIGPSGANLAINAANPIPQGADIARANRDAVHGAWDKPRQAILDAFVALNPQWKTDPLEKPFEWKWYYAFQHLGDLKVGAQSQAYCDGILRREHAAQKVGWLLAPLGIQAALTRIARTDVQAQLAYQAQVRAFHHDVRNFYYRYLFAELPFPASQFGLAPTFTPTHSAIKQSDLCSQHN